MAEKWKPGPWNAELAGCLWMRRMLDKGRRALENGQVLTGGYLFGKSSYMDRRMLKFLRTDEARVLELLQRHEDDVVVAETLVRESGRSPGELNSWNRRFRRRYGLFMAMCEADEGARKPGWITSLLKLVYNGLIMPPLYIYSRWLSRR